MSVAMSEVAAAPPATAGGGYLARMRRGRTQWLVRVAAVAALYYGAAQLGYALRFAGPVAAIVWLPVGVAIAALSIGGLSAWPGVLIGDLLANDYGALPLVGALGQTCGNMLEVLLAATLLRAGGRADSVLRTMTGVVRLVLAVAAGAALSAIIGPLSLVMSGTLGLHAV